METDVVNTSIRHLVDSAGILPSGSTVLVAVSGGQDSCALLHSLVQISDELALKVHAAHFNHQLRGEEADADEEFVRQFAESMRLPFHRGGKDIRAAARRLHVSVQEAARDARRRFLEELAHEIGADRIALGHTRDDHIETVLLNIIRGAGIDGLGGLKPVQGSIIRPLLEASRDATGEYCRQYGIAFREDASNRSSKYLRNRVRQELLPLLGSYYNPAIGEALVRLSRIAGDESAFMDNLTENALESSLLNRQRGLLVLCTEKLALLDRALLRRALRKGIEEVRGQLTDVDSGTIEAIAEAVLGGQLILRTLPGASVKVGVRPDAVCISRRDAPASTRNFKREIEFPGRTEVPELSLAVTAEAICSWDGLTQSDPVLIADSDRIGWPLRIRTWRTGDRIRPIGMSGEKKLQDLFVDRKVPVRDRKHVPVIEDEAGIIWVVGHAVADRVRATDGTCEAIRIEVKSAPSF